MDKNRILECIRFILSGFEEIDLAYVYGSFLKRDDFRDIDIAIHISRELAAYQRFKLSSKVAGSLEKKIQPRVEFDLRVLNCAPAYFQYEVISQGMVVLERDQDMRVDYEAHLISEYLLVSYKY